MKCYRWWSLSQSLCIKYLNLKYIHTTYIHETWSQWVSSHGKNMGKPWHEAIDPASFPTSNCIGWLKSTRPGDLRFLSLLYLSFSLSTSLSLSSHVCMYVYIHLLTHSLVFHVQTSSRVSYLGKFDSHQCPKVFGNSIGRSR